MIYFVFYFLFLQIYFVYTSVSFVFSRRLAAAAALCLDPCAALGSI